MTRFLALLFSCLLAIPALTAREYSLVVNGQAKCRIQLSPRPSAPEFEAARELQDHIRLITGCHLNRSTYPGVFYRVMKDPELVEIFLTTPESGSRIMPADMLAKLKAAGSDQAFYIRTDGPRIIIAGLRPLGVLYGAYTLLEKYMNVRWFHPGPDGIVLEKKKSLSLPEIDFFDEPDVQSRVISTWSKAARPYTMEEVELWMRRNKMHHGGAFHYNDRSRQQLLEYECGGSSPGGGGHLTFEHSVPPGLFKTRPELFPLKNGKRVCESRSQRCLSNPAVQKMVADYITEMVRYGASFSISYHDSTDGWCTCSKCLAMGTVNGQFSYSNAAHKFTSLIAGKVFEKVPDADLRVDMYSQFRPLPTDKTIRYDKRLLAVYCPHQRCYVHPFTDRNSSCNRRFLKEFEEWRKLYPKVGFFEYYCAARSPYAPFEYVFGEDAKYYKQIGMHTWIEDCTHHKIPYLFTNWQFYYAASKLLWNADQSVDALMEDVFRRYYGKAAVPMTAYHHFRRELWESAPGHALYGGANRIGYCLSNPAAEKRLRGYLAQALRLAGNDQVLRRRIAMDQKSLEDYWVPAAEKIRKISSGQNAVPAARKLGSLTIDGRLDEADWRRAPLVTGFLSSDKNEPAEETRVKVLYDQDNWYIGIEAMTEKAWGKLQANARKATDPVWQDDSMEIFIAPPQQDYYHWIINTIGTMYQAKMRDSTFQSGADRKVTVSKDRYTMEIRIPVKPMNASIIRGQAWQMHFCRTMKNLQPPKNAASASLDGTEPHNQIAFRRVFIGENLFRNGNFTEIVPRSPQQTKILTPNFPKGWSGGQAGLVSEGRNVNKIHIKNGYISQWLAFRPSPDPQIFTGEIKVKGKGNFSTHISSCCRPPENKKSFSHENKRMLIERQKLTGGDQLLRFSLELAPYEMGYFDVYADDAVISYISGSLTPRKK